MHIDLVCATAAEILSLRERYREEMACQIVHDSFPQRGLSDPFLLRIDGEVAGYGTVGNKYPAGMVDEFFVLPEHRAAALMLFRQLLATSGATAIRAQTNDTLMLLMLYDCAENITSDTILFHDALATDLTCAEGRFRKLTEADKAQVFEHRTEPVGEWGIESGGRLVATGGMLFHYNPPYADLFMEVDEAYRRRGFGSYLVQELKRVCYEMGKAPAARCGVSNVASRRTLERTGMFPCGRVLVGEVVK